MTLARSKAACCASIIAGVSSRLAPATITMVFCPLSATVTQAMPVGAPACAVTIAVSTPSRRRPSRKAVPWGSSPTQPSMATRLPRRAAATAWLAPLPPGMVSSAGAETVCPAWGKQGVRITRSMLRLPTTSTSAAAGERTERLATMVG